MLLALVTVASAQDDLIRQLKSPSASKRRSAAAMLGRKGKEAAAAVPALVEALKDSNSLVRFQSIVALGDIGSEQAISGLQPLLHTPDVRTRQLVATSLAKIGGRAAAVLTEALQAKQSATREAAADGLRQLGAPKESRAALRAALADESGTVRAFAAWALLPDDDAATALVTLVAADDARSATTAVRALRAVGPRNETVARCLLAAVASKHEALQWNAASALADFPKQVLAMRADIYPHLTRARFSVRAALASALRPVAKLHLDELFAVLRAHDQVAPHVALACADNAAAAVDAAAALLSHEDAAVAGRAAHFLAAMGKHAKPQVTALAEAAKRPEPVVGVHAARALWVLERDATLVYPALQRGLSGPTAIRLLAIESLGSLGPAALDAAPMLELAAKSKDARIARAAKIALRRIRK